MRYSLEETLDQFKQVWLTEENWKDLNKKKIEFNRENKELKRKVSIAKLANNKLAEDL